MKDKVVWITGASSGIGEAMAKQFSKRGAKLILTARRKDKLAKVNSELVMNRGTARILPYDLENLEGIEELVETAWSYYGRIDYFVSNAGVAVKDFVLNTDFSIDQKLRR